MSFVEEFDSLSIVTLLAQVAGLLLAVVVVAAVRGRSVATRDLPVAAAIVAVLLSAWLFVTTLRSSAKSLDDFRKSTDTKVETEKNLACATQALIDVPFVDWAKRRMGPRAKYHLVVSPKTKQLDGQFCLRLLLLPSVQVRRYEDADWVIFYEDNPAREIERAERRGGQFLLPDKTNADRILVRFRD